MQYDQLRRISGEFLIIMSTLFSMAAGAIWYVSSLDGRVMSLERERDIGERNTASQGLVRDAQIQALMDIVLDHSETNKAIERRLDSIAEDVAVLRGRE